MQSVFASPRLPAGPQLLLGVELPGRQAGQQSHGFVCAALALAPPQHSLRRKGKPDFFGIGLAGGTGPAFPAAFVFSTVRAWVGVGSRGGKTRSGSGAEVFDVLAQRGLVACDGRQVIGPVLQDQVAPGLILGVQRGQRHAPAGQCHLPEELPGGGDFAGPGVHQRAAQIKLAGDRPGAQARIPGAVPGLFAVHDKQICPGRAAPPLFLDVQEGLVDLVPSQLFEQARKGGLAGGGIFAPGMAAEAQSPALGWVRRRAHCATVQPIHFSRAFKCLAAALKGSSASQSPGALTAT